ncbi:MAG: HAD-IC family P-type ATPase, partial [Burkholderiales bacterium]|nr:HAD-IC family P-type ATPase [Burkholderiales bacterium]
MADTPHSSCGCDADACAAPVTWTAPRPASGDAQHDHAGHAHDHNHDQSAGVVRLGAALVLALIAEALHFVTGDSGVTIPLGLAVAGVAIWLAGAGTYASGIKALRRGRLGINGLMSVAVTGAFLIGRWPEAAMVMALYAIAEMIEVRAAGRARNAIRSLLALAPEQAEVLQSDGRWQTAAAEQIALQAIVRIKPGARVPLDGIITDGQSAVNQAPVTGESLPVDRTVGDMVYAGTINGSGELQFRVTATASSTTLARIIHAVEQAQATRAPTQRLVDRFAVVYTPAVFVLALATAVLVPWLTGLSWLAAAYEALVLLVIACPCALVISTPVTVVSALAAAARRGILIKGGSHLENARSL